MRKMFMVVAVGAVALGFTACSQDIAGPTGAPQFGNTDSPGYYQRSTEVAPAENTSKINDCGWDALRRADGQVVEKGLCKL